MTAVHLETDFDKKTLIQKISTFLQGIGIPVEQKSFSHESFLPGIYINNGGLIVDTEKLLYPGDLLHEAGHIAVMKREDRSTTSGNVGEQRNENDAAAEELTAIAWSYAALVHLNIPPEVVFHKQGYKGAADWYIEQYTGGTYIALPALQWMGLCYDEKQAPVHGTKPYPHMIKWLRD